MGLGAGCERGGAAFVGKGEGKKQRRGALQAVGRKSGVAAAAADDDSVKSEGLTIDIFKLIFCGISRSKT